MLQQYLDVIEIHQSGTIVAVRDFGSDTLCDVHVNRHRMKPV
jgi:hypothetical protein